MCGFVGFVGKQKKETKNKIIKGAQLISELRANLFFCKEKTNLN